MKVKVETIIYLDTDKKKKEKLMSINKSAKNSGISFIVKSKNLEKELR